MHQSGFHNIIRKYCGKIRKGLSVRQSGQMGAEMKMEEKNSREEIYTAEKAFSWEENIRKVVPYVPGEQPDKQNVIKLNTNECPYPPAPLVEKALQEFDHKNLRLYPDPEASVLTEALAGYYGVEKEQVFVGVGSDDVLAMSFMTFFNSEKPILFPDITYSFYDVWAELYRIPYKTVPLTEEFLINPKDYHTENGGIVFPNPNAPTGVLESLEFIEDIVAANPDVVVIVDEAYIDFGGESALPLLKKYDNLLIVQTFSKSRAMAGMRIGYAIGNKKLISYLNNVKFSFNSYTMDRVTLQLGAAAVKDEAYFRETLAKVIKTREWTKEKLAALGFVFGDSKSNFIFAAHREKKAEEIFTYLRSKDIFVRYFRKPRIDNYLRISIGTDEEMEILIKELTAFLK